MELLQLKYFYVAAECEHITSAAQRLHIAQPALTQTIKRLESELGVKLFIKKGRSIALSESGKYLYKRLGEILPQLDAIPEEIAKIDDIEQSTIKLNVLAASLLVTYFIIEFKKLYPSIKFQLMQSEDDKVCDLTISTARQRRTDSLKQSKNLKQVSFAEEIRLALPSNSPYAKRKSIDLWDMRNEGFIILSSGKPFHKVCESLCRTAGFSPNIVFESDSPTAVRDLIGAGMGIGFWPAYSWGDVGSDDVTVIPISNPIANREIIFTCTSPETDLSYSFYNFMIEHMHNMKNFSE